MGNPGGRVNTPRDMDIGNSSAGKGFFGGRVQGNLVQIMVGLVGQNDTVRET